MKKKGIMEKLVTVGVVAASIGGTLYLLKDKIEENPKYKEAIDKAKDKIKAYTNPDLSEEDLDAFDDVEEFDDILPSQTDRGYVTIKLHNEDEEVMDSAADYSEDE